LELFYTEYLNPFGEDMANLDELVKKLSGLTPDESAKLAENLTEEWGLPGPTAVGIPLPLVQAGKVEEQTEFAVELISFGTNKIGAIKAVRALTSLGLKESKELVERAPVYIQEGVSSDVAEESQRILEAAGAIVAVK
jgi:large subunit ribosomal protein L7/L12